MACRHCDSTDVIGPFTMDGHQEGEYRSDWSWLVCRECHRSTGLGR
jgi:hypothetical protein